MRHTPTYNQISALSRDLGDNAVKKSRAAGDGLIKMLGEERVRRRLAEEATPTDLQPGDPGVQAIRRKALAQIWRLVITRAIASVENIRDETKKKTKLTDADIRLPFKLLQLCDMPDELFGADTPKLSRVETKLVLNYCINMLCWEDNKVKDTHGGVRSLLQMLSHICSKREHVAYFRPDQQVNVILQELERFLLIQEEDDDDERERSVAQLPFVVDPDIAHLCAKIFGELLATLHDLGIALHLILPGTLKMVAKWCHQNRHRSDLSGFAGILSGAAVLLRSSPDLAVAPLTRYGRPILSFVRKRLGRPGPLDAALTEYLLRHL